MSEIVLVLNNVRSCHNVGAMLRTAEGLGVKKVILVGYTPYPRLANDARLPHISDKITRQISKTALGAEKMLDIEHITDLASALKLLAKDGFTICAVEQSDKSVRLPDYQPPAKLALLMGNEVSGLDASELALVDLTLEIPMFGAKESFNVASSAAIALYHCRFFSEST